MTERGGIRVGRRGVLSWALGGAALTLRPEHGLAQPDVLSTADEPHHHVIFENATLRLMRVLIPPGDSTQWHRQEHDYVVAVLRGTLIRTETEGRPATGGEMVTDSVSFAGYEGHPAIRRVTNTSTWLNHQVAFEILLPAPGGFGPADRSHAPAFSPVLDNARVRAWRLKLQPGAITPPIAQGGPGVRVMLSGGRVIDAPPGTRAVVNGGNGPLDLIEFELR